MQSHTKYCNLFKRTVLFSSIFLSMYSTVQAKTDHDKVYQLETLEIEATTDSGSAVSPSANKQKRQEALKNIAGSTSFIDQQQLNEQRISTNQDILSYQAGIVAKSPSNEGTKVMVRGSGINRLSGAHGSGVTILFDDLPLTGVGGTPYELQETHWIDGVEIYRGANGLSKNATSLGGAINYLSKTGKDSHKLALHYEMGSYGYQKYSISSGQDFGHWDYFISLAGSDYDGYQAHSAGDSKGVMANIGWKISPNIDTRFYLRYRETFHQSSISASGALTKQQVHTTPRMSNAFNAQYDAFRKQPGSTWFANKTSIQLKNHANLVLGLAYHHYPMDLQDSLYRTDINYHDLVAYMNYSQPLKLFGLDSLAKITFTSTSHLPHTNGMESMRFDSTTTETYYNNQNRYLTDLPAGSLARKYRLRGSDQVLTFSNDLQLNRQLWLMTELATIYSRRGHDVTYPAGGDGYQHDEWNIAPRLGVRYQFSPDIQLFANVSRSVELPHPWSLGWSGNKFFANTSGAASGRPSSFAALQTQTATSVEVGSRGKTRFADWNASIYRSWVRHELLQHIPNGYGFAVEYNASPTIHQGAELALNHTLWQHQNKGKINLRQAYTYSHFHYKNDPVLGKNQLPAIPKHFYQAELRYSHPNGFYAGINTEYASKKFVDYQNTFFADSYHIFGATLGYQAQQQKWQTWLDFRNLTNKHYVATLHPKYDAKGQDSANFLPGEGFGAYWGISIQF